VPGPFSQWLPAEARKTRGATLRVQLFAGETKNKTKQKKSLALRRCNDAEHRSLTAAHVQPPKGKRKKIKIRKPLCMQRKKKNRKGAIMDIRISS
jgi:hypothetical protein